MTSPNSGEKKLTHKQRVFCEQYVISHNATQAAIAAGYKSSTAYSTGSENLKKPEIKKYIKKLEKAALEKATKGAIATRAEILETLTELFRDKDVSVKDRLKSAQLLGDYYALFKGLEDAGNDRTVTVIVDDVPDDSVFCIITNKKYLAEKVINACINAACNSFRDVRKMRVAFVNTISMFVCGE